MHAHGYAYRQRPVSQASRSQRIFYALAKSFAALPKVPPNVTASAGGSVPSTPTSPSGTEEAEETEKDLEGTGADGPTLEKLLAVGGRAGDPAAEAEMLNEEEEAVSGSGANTPTPLTTSEPEEMTPEEQLQSPVAKDSSGDRPRSEPEPGLQTPSAQPKDSYVLPNQPSPDPNDSAILPTPAKLSRRPGFRIEIPDKPGSQPSSPSTSSPARSPGFRSSAYNFAKRGEASSNRKSRTQDPRGKHSSVPSSRASSRASSPVRRPVFASPRPAGDAAAPLPPEHWPSHFTLPSDPAALPRMHTNLHTRLLPFLGSKLANRKVRLRVLPVLPDGTLYDGVLATKIVRTHASSGGGFKTTLDITGPELRKWLEWVGGKGSGAKTESSTAAAAAAAQATGLEALGVRVVAELLEPDSGIPSVLHTAPGSGIGIGSSYDADLNAAATAWDEVELDVAIQGEGGEGGGVRIVSDVDDTIKVRGSLHTSLSATPELTLTSTVDRGDEGHQDDLPERLCPRTPRHPRPGHGRMVPVDELPRCPIPLRVELAGRALARPQDVPEAGWLPERELHSEGVRRRE